jgi:uncharacterized membrane protein YgcG
MSITYHIGDTEKSDGFKYVGYATIADLSCSDAEGNPLACSVQEDNETKLVWVFPPQRDTDYTVKLSFLMKHAVGWDGDIRFINAGWAGVFKVPVRQATWTIKLPDGAGPDGPPTPYLRVSPFNTFPLPRSDYSQQSFKMNPLNPKNLMVGWGTQSELARWENPEEVANPSSIDWEPVVSFGLPIAIFGVVAIFMVRKNRRGRGGLSGGSSSGNSSGGCSGSSCSGGGCGGGGCGGGCGG